MREIKFRAWHKEEKRYYVVERINFLDFEVWARVNGDFGIFNFKSVILEQYTGLKDKNDIEIFVGDVVKLYVNGDVVITKVFYNEYGLSYAFEDANDVGLFYILDYEEMDLEVIGNIHENTIKED